MKPHPILEALAAAYEKSKATRSEKFVTNFEKLLVKAHCAEGDRRALAEEALRAAERHGLLKLVPVSARDPDNIHTIHFFSAKESELYSILGRPSPNQRRAANAEIIRAAVDSSVPEQWQSGWRAWSQRKAEQGAAIDPEVLSLLPKLLSWEGEFSLRLASAELCGDSKKLERLATELGGHLAEITAKQINSLEDIGIIPNPRSALLHGPLRLDFENSSIDFEILRGPIRLSIDDIVRAKHIITSAKICLTIENETPFHEIARLQSGVLLICTSFPGRATVEFIRRLPTSLEFHHFGDSDDAGFEILEDLRAKTGFDFRPLHMERGRQPFEQESLGRPRKSTFPFY